jgi:hypothetical protein
MGYLSAEEIAAYADSGKDLPEADVDGVFGGRVRIRALTAAQNARIQQQSGQFSGKGVTIDFVEMERLKVQYAVIEPKLDADQVKRLHIKSGPSFMKLVAEIDALSGTSEEGLRQAEQEFQGPSGDEE